MRELWLQSREKSRKLASGFAAFGVQLEKEGRTPYLLSFMFHHIQGSSLDVARQMERELERVFSIHLTRIVRKPRSLGSKDGLPIWICAPDYPVFKHEKQTLNDLVLNGGRHFHAVAFMPERSRLKEGLEKHFDKNRDLYIRGAMARINVELITHKIGFVLDYVLKSLKAARTTPDDLLILPRTLGELAAL